MSDEVISIEEVIAYSLDTFPGLTILAVGWTVTTLLLVVLVSFVLIPVIAIVSVVPFVHAGYAAYRVSQGEEYLYHFIADLVEGR